MLDLLSDATTAKAQSVRRFYQPELDGLRFYAFLGVFVGHTLPFDDLFYQRLHLPLPWIWGAAVRAGGAGVDLFFALSAYLITSLLLREAGRPATCHFGCSISDARCASGRSIFW